MKAPHPGTVASDEQAFNQISARFRDEVGRILSHVNFEAGPVPFWSLTRTMFPVAESLGDLIYRRDRATAHNLRSVLENEFEQVRAGYAGKAAVLALLYRHSLTHHDELRVLVIGGKEVGWTISGADDGRHLRVDRAPSGVFRVEFQPRAFYSDILNVCGRAARLNWGGSVAQRYNGWMTLDVAKVRPDSTVNAAKAEVAAF